MSRQEVIAVIPNYNMAASLAELLPQVIAQNYDMVYVLDDCSTDDSLLVSQSFGEKVQVIAGDKNVGSGANRNRILKALTPNPDAIIHFIDADTSLDTKNTPAIACSVFADPKIVVVGGLVTNRDGLQMVWNWGQRFTPRAYVSGLVASKFEALNVKDPKKAYAYWQRFRFLVGDDRPDPFKKPVVKDVFWISEANMLIRASLFKDLGGFDEKLRVHDIFGIAIKLKLAGLGCRFDPSIAVTHKAIDVRGSGRKQEEKKANIYLLKKYGRRFFF